MAAQNLGELIEKIFKWAINLVGITIFFAFVYAGFLWFTAAGRLQPIAKAKEVMTNAIIGLIIFLASYLILNTINPDLVKQTFTLPGVGTQQPSGGGGGGDGGGGGGNYVCADKGGTADYRGNLQTAIEAVISNNPNGIADAPNNVDNALTFLNFVAEELRSSGLNATTNVLNGNDNPNSGDLIAIWRSDDGAVERYDAVWGEPPTIREAAVVQFAGDIPLSCAGAGDGGEPPQPPELPAP